jgi:hypothetical protein
LASQSTISRLENAPSKTEAARLGVALLDQFGTTVKPARFEILDIDDTFCAAHGGQQLAFWNAHHDERGFASMHIYHVASGAPVATILRLARTPKGTEVRTVVKHVTKRLRQHWPDTRIVWRGDGHYGRIEAMEWTEENETPLAARPVSDSCRLDAPRNSAALGHMLSSPREQASDRSAGRSSFATLRALKFCGWHRPNAAEPGAAGGRQVSSPDLLCRRSCAT